MHSVLDPVSNDRTRTLSVLTDSSSCSLPAVTLERASRILYIWYAPPVPFRLGPARRHYHVLDQLSRFYHVSFLSLGEAGDAEAFERRFGDRVADFTFVRRKIGWTRTRITKIARTFAGRCDFMPVFEPDFRRACARICAADRFDAIVLSSVLLRRLPLPAGVPIVGDTHNVEFDVLRRTAAAADHLVLRQHAARQWPATREEEQRCARAVDLLLATSPRDRDLLERELGLGHVAVVPNGIDLKEFRLAECAPEPGAILFSGLMSYYPNQQAVRWFAREVFPRIRDRVPNAKLIVAGASPPRWLRSRAGPDLEVTGQVADIRPFIARASVVVAPLLIGGGTRVKILEAQAMGRPVVSTTIGAEGLGLQDDESVRIADTAAVFAQRVSETLTDIRAAERIALGGHRHVVQHFDWDRIGEHVSVLFASRLGLSTTPEPVAAAVHGIKAVGS